MIFFVDKILFMDYYDHNILIHSYSSSDPRLGFNLTFDRMGAHHQVAESITITAVQYSLGKPSGMVIEFVE